MAKKLTSEEIKKQVYSEFPGKASRQDRDYTNVILGEIKSIEKNYSGLTKQQKLQKLYGDVWKHERLEGLPVPEPILTALTKANGKKIELPEELHVASAFTVAKYSIIPQVKAKQIKQNKDLLSTMIRYGSFGENDMIKKYRELLNASIKSGKPIDENKLEALRKRKAELVDEAWHQAHDPSHLYRISEDRYKQIKDRLSFTVTNATKQILTSEGYTNDSKGASNHYQDQLDCLDHIYDQKKEKYSRSYTTNEGKNTNLYKDTLESLETLNRKGGSYYKLLEAEYTTLRQKREAIEERLYQQKQAEEKAKEEKRDEKRKEEFIESKSRPSATLVRTSDNRVLNTTQKAIDAVNDAIEKEASARVAAETSARIEAIREDMKDDGPEM